MYTVAGQMTDQERVRDAVATAEDLMGLPASWKLEGDPETAATVRDIALQLEPGVEIMGIIIGQDR